MANGKVIHGIPDHTSLKRPRLDLMELVGFLAIAWRAGSVPVTRTRQLKYTLDPANWLRALLELVSSLAPYARTPEFSRDVSRHRPLDGYFHDHNRSTIRIKDFEICYRSLAWPKSLRCAPISLSKWEGGGPIFAPPWDGEIVHLSI